MSDASVGTYRPNESSYVWSHVQPTEEPFLYRVWAYLEATLQSSHYFFTEEEQKLAHPTREEKWFERIAPYLHGKIHWPPERKPKPEAWKRLQLPYPLPEDFSLAPYLAEMRSARSTYRSQSKAPSNRRPYQRRSKADLLELPSSSNDPGCSSFMAGTGFQHSSSNTSSTPARPLTNEIPDGCPTLESLSNMKTVYDLRIDESQTHHTWHGNDGSVLYTPKPCWVSETGHNVLWKAVDRLTILSSMGFVARTSDEITVVNQPTSEDCIYSLVSEAMSRNRPVFVKGPREQGSWKNGLDKLYLEGLFIEPLRQCDVFDFVDNEIKALEGGEADQTDEDTEFEHKADLAATDEVWYPEDDHGCTPNPGDTTSMTFEDFLFCVRNKRGIKYILDLPTTRSRGIPYGCFNHLERAVDNSKELPDNLIWPDFSWSLAHDGPTVTWWHHDSDGKMTIVNATSGAKVWTLFVPKPDLGPSKLERVHRWLAGSKDKLPNDKLGKVVNVLLLPGDTLFMPPGMMHLVFTPVPSVFKGSSFWNFDCIHLTALALRADSAAAHILTNVDHDFETVFRSIVRLVIAIPVMSSWGFFINQAIRRGVIYSLYDILVNTKNYIFILKKDDDYPTAEQVDELVRGPPMKKARRGRQSKSKVQEPPMSKDKATQILLQQAKFKRFRRLHEDIPYVNIALNMLETMITLDGRKAPVSLEQKSNTSAIWIDTLMQQGDWMEAGEIVAADLPTLKLFWYPKQT
ncbi:Lsd1/2 complex PHD finger containing protein Phf2 [Marasmius sp. AFHP31]|nr:Lsd1/2 complex PHD finger containing protein Phf2 [Marasmius sp. AFHP31]